MPRPDRFPPRLRHLPAWCLLLSLSAFVVGVLPACVVGSAPCHPACQLGYACVEGACVSRCTPECPLGYVCDLGNDWVEECERRFDETPTVI